MNEWIEAWLPALAAGGSTAGALVALDQLTLRNRMRRVMEWSSTLLEREESENRRKPLNLIYSWAAGRLVAHTLVPIRHYFEAIFWTVLVVFTTLRIDSEGSDLVFYGVAISTLLFLTYRRAIRVYREQYRLAVLYMRGKLHNPPALRLMDKMEGGDRNEFVWSCFGATGITLLLIGTQLLLRESVVPGLWTSTIGVGLTGIAIAGLKRWNPDPLVEDWDTSLPER